MSGKLDTTNDFKSAGLRNREYSKFRSPRGSDIVVATQIEGVATYSASVNATAANATAVVAAPGAGKCIMVKTLYVNNAGVAQRVVSFKEGAGDHKFKSSMPPLGATWNFNLVGAYWILKANTALNVNLDQIGDINVQVGYDIVDSIDTALTDALTIAEDLETVSA